MNINTQITSFYAFFLYGLSLTLIYELFLKRKKYLCYLIFPLTTIIFTYFLFSINGGKIHPYFVLIFICGITFGKVLKKVLSKKTNIIKQKLLKNKKLKNNKTQ